MKNLNFIGILLITLTIFSIFFISCNSKSHNNRGNGTIISIIDAIQKTKEKQENERIKRMVDKTLRNDFNKICITKRICEKIALYPEKVTLSNLARYKLGFLAKNEKTLNLKSISLLFDELEQNNENSVIIINKRITKLKENHFINKQKLIDLEVAKYNKLLDICESIVLSKINCE